MDKIGVITSFLSAIVIYNIPLLYGTVGEIIVEKSGSLNLGVEGIMAVGAIFGYMLGCYSNSLVVGILSAFLIGAL
ncbi:MAG: ABC transporter permease, partial [Clostridia bacterium]|nr:ABC transporter permease [Clostridia bacterium]